MELDGAGTVTGKYVRGINLITSEDGAGVKKYFLYNGHGDAVQLTEPSGNVVKSYVYDAFGNEATPDPADTNPFRYCGEYFDKETGTIYLRARYYDPGIGRFITEDSNRGDELFAAVLFKIFPDQSIQINGFHLPAGHCLFERRHFQYG